MYSTGNSYSGAPSVTYFNDISCEIKISVEISAVNICKICGFSGEKIFSPHSAGSGENFLSPLKRRRKIFHRLKVFFSPHSSH